MRKLIVTLALIAPFAAMAGGHGHDSHGPEQRDSRGGHDSKGRPDWSWGGGKSSLGCKYADYQRKNVEMPLGLAGLAAVGWIVRRKSKSQAA